MQTKTQRFCRVDRLIIDPKRKPWWLLYMRASGVRPSSLCCRSMTLSYRLPWVSDRCKGLSFFFFCFFFCEFHQGHWTGYCALWSNRAVPCWPGWHLLFVSAPLLTSTSYCHVVSWGSCQGEQSPSTLTTTGLITWTPQYRREVFPKGGVHRYCCCDQFEHDKYIQKGVHYIAN